MGTKKYHLQFDSLSEVGDMTVTYESPTTPDVVGIHSKVDRGVYVRGSTYAKVNLVVTYLKIKYIGFVFTKVQDLGNMDNVNE